MTALDSSYARERTSAPRAGTRDVGAGWGRPALPDPPDIPRDAAIKRDKETGGWVDRYRRTAEKCRADAELAGKHADALAEVRRSLEAGELAPAHERVFGVKLLNRLEADWLKFERLRSRDHGWADAIDALLAWDLACARVEESPS